MSFREGKENPPIRLPRLMTKPIVSPSNSPPLQLGTVQHMLNSCTGFSDTDSRLTIQSRPLRNVVETPHPFVIPLFQRKYCWTTEQADRWIADCIRNVKIADADAGAKLLHTVGKIYLKLCSTNGRDSHFILIDGQQRITTMLLTLCAVRDAALCCIAFAEKHGNSFFLEDDKIATTQQSHRSLQALVEQMEAYMFFRDPAAHDDGCLEIPLATSLSDAHRLASCCRLRTSRGDETAFYSLLSLGRRSLMQCSDFCRRKPDEQMAQEDTSLFAAFYHRWMDHYLLTSGAAASMQAQVKNVFDIAIRKKILLECSSLTMRSELFVEKVYKQLDVIVRGMLDGMGYIYVEILNEIPLAQVFLWLQEKSLFGIGALLYNASPGIDFHASDLARNLLLAPFMEEPSLLSTVYHTYWYDKVERAAPSPVALDKCMREMLRGLSPADAAHQSPLEKSLKAMFGTLNQHDPRQISQGMLLYLKFHSYHDLCIRKELATNPLACNVAAVVKAREKHATQSTETDQLPIAVERAVAKRLMNELSQATRRTRSVVEMEPKSD